MVEHLRAVRNRTKEGKSIAEIIRDLVEEGEDRISIHSALSEPLSKLEENNWELYEQLYELDSEIFMLSDAFHPKSLESFWTDKERREMSFIPQMEGLSYWKTGGVVPNMRLFTGS